MAVPDHIVYSKLAYILIFCHISINSLEIKYMYQLNLVDLIPFVNYDIYLYLELYI